MPKVSDAHKQAVRQGILDAAFRLVADGDYSRLTTRSVIEEAGVSNGTLYHYFPSLDHLYAEMAEVSLRDAVGRIGRSPVDGLNDAITTAGPDPLDRLVAWLRDEFFGDRQLAAAIATFRSHIELGDDQRDAVEGLNRYAVSHFGELVRHLQSAGAIRDLDGARGLKVTDELAEM